MASSEKPDFIEIDEKTPSAKLTEGTDAAADEPDAAAVSAETDLAAVSAETEGAGDKAFSADVKSRLPAGSMNDGPPSEKKGLPINRPMRKLPFGSVTFIGLLVAISACGNQIDELRKQTLITLSSKLYMNGKGYVESVADLSNMYRFRNDSKADAATLNKGIAVLALNNQDKGAKGAYLRLRLAQIAGQDGQIDEAKSLATKALSMIEAGGTYVPYDLPLALSGLAWRLDDYWEYKTALALNLKANELWPTNRPNYRSHVRYTIGFEYNRLGQFDKAEPFLKQALLQSLSWGDDDDNVRRFLQLGISQAGQKKYAEADTNLNSALRMQRNLTRSKRDTLLAEINTELGKVRAAQGDTLMARKYLEQAAETLKTKRRASYHYLQNQYALANLYRDIGEKNLAMPIYDQLILRLRDGEHGPDIKDVERDRDLLRDQSGGK